MNGNINRNIEILLGDPKKAIIKLAVPIMIGSIVQTLYNFVDGVWVSGVGADALAAVGLFMPFMMILSAIAMGIGVGGSSAISRAIGAKNRQRASNVAEHTLIMGTLIGTAISYLLIPFLSRIFTYMGAGPEVVRFASAYGIVVIIVAPLMFLGNLGNAILRGEGDTKRAMYIMLISSIINMILDPIFIFYLRMGVVGAAVATDLSIAVSAAFIMYWLTVKKNTYVQLQLRYFRKNWDIIREIFSVGLPSSIAQISMSFTMIVLNTIVLYAGGDYGMSVFSGGWRIVIMAIVPIMGISVSVTSVTGAAYGAKNFEKLKSAYLYGVKIGTAIGALTGTLIWLFAPQLTYLFTYSPGSAYLAPGIIQFLRYIVLFFPGAAAGMLTSSMFRGVKLGTYSLIQTIIRALIMQILFAYILGIFFGLGLSGIWIGIVVANITASIIALPWGLITIDKIRRKWEILNNCKSTSEHGQGIKENP